METLYYAIIYIVAAFIIFYYCENQFVRKRAYASTIAVLFLCYSIYCGLTLMEIISLNILLFITSTFVFIILCYNLSWKSALLHTLIAAAMMGLSEIIVISLFRSFFVNVFEVSVNEPLFLVLSLISKIIYFIFLCILIKLGKNTRKNDITENKLSSTLILFPALSLIILVSYGYIYINIEIDDKLSALLLIGTLVIIIMNIAIFAIYEKIHKQNQILLENRLLAQAEADKSTFYDYMNKKEESRNSLIHDYKKNLQTISDLSIAGNNKEITKYIEEILNTAAFTSTRKVSDNNLINSIIGRYISLCNIENIRFDIDIRSNTLSFLSDYEITGLLYNLLDNALEAVRNSKTVDRFIDFYILTNDTNGRIDIKLINSCSTPPEISNNGLPKSSKRNKEAHGHGMKIIKNIIENHNGHMMVAFDDANNAFKTIIIMSP